MKLKKDLLDITTELLQKGIPFDIKREKSFVRLLTDTHEITFKNTGMIIECFKLTGPRRIGEKIKD